jgi:hypothetical protein
VKRYKVHFKDKKDAIYEAYSYTVKDGNYWFHKKEDKTDFESFAVFTDVHGIDEQAPVATFEPVSPR